MLLTMTVQRAKNNGAFEQETIFFFSPQFSNKLVIIGPLLLSVSLQVLHDISQHMTKSHEQPKTLETGRIRPKGNRREAKQGEPMTESKGQRRKPPRVGAEGWSIWWHVT